MEAIFDTQLKDVNVIDALREAKVESPELVYATCLQRANELKASPSNNAANLDVEDIASLLLFTFSYSVLPPDHSDVCGLTPLDALNIGLASGEYPSVRALLWVMWSALRKLPHEYFPAVFARIPVKVLSASDDEERVVKSAFLKASLDPNAVGGAIVSSHSGVVAVAAASSPAGTSPNPLGESSLLSTSGSAVSSVSLSRFLVKLTGFVSVYNLEMFSFFPGRQSK